MSEDENTTISIDLDTAPAQKKLADLEANVKEKTTASNVLMDAVDTRQTQSWNSIISYSRGVWNILDTTMEIFGVTMSKSLRMVVSGIFAAVGPLMEIATAQEVSGVMVVQGALAMASLVSAILGAYQLELGINQQDQQFMYMQHMLRLVLNFSGRFG